MMRYFIASILAITLLCGCFGPKKAKCEVKEIHRLGWWTKNANMTIESFDVKVVESNLNLFNTTAKVSYTITGTMKYNKGYEASISAIHVSERYEMADTNMQIAIHEFTPVMSTTSSKKSVGGVKKFTVTNEHYVSSYKWGTNTFRFVCANFIQDVELVQKK